MRRRATNHFLCAGVAGILIASGTHSAVATTTPVDARQLLSVHRIAGQEDLRALQPAVPSQVFLAFSEPAPTNPADPCRTGATYRQNVVGDHDELTVCTFDSTGAPAPTDATDYRLQWTITDTEGKSPRSVQFNPAPPTETTGAGASANAGVDAVGKGADFIKVSLVDPSGAAIDNFSIEKQVREASGVYVRGFEPPKFDEGVLVGQDGWFGYLGMDAATVSHELPKTGIQSVRIDGAQLTQTSGFYTGSYARFVNYEPVKSGLPIVHISGNIRLGVKGGAHRPSAATEPPTCGMGIGVSAQMNGEYIANILIGVRGRRGRLVSYISNMDGVHANGPRYSLGKWASVEAVFNFNTRVARGYFNGHSMGRIPFTEGAGNDLPAINLFLASSKPIPNTLGYLDDFSLEATNPRRD